MPLAEFLAIALPIAQALHAAHQRKIYHRDLKPDNVMVLKSNDAYKVRVIDFGLALRCEVVKRSVSQKAYSRALLGAAAAGTAKYAPPEQMGDLDYPIGPYSDVYAFGKTCCQMLFRVLEPKSRHWKCVPEPLAHVLEKCMEEYLTHRHADFGPIITALQSLSAQEDSDDHGGHPTTKPAPSQQPAEPKSATGAGNNRPLSFTIKDVGITPCG
jgi:serine/threonine protein kinase